MRNKWKIMLSLVLLMSMVLSGCKPATPEATEKPAEPVKTEAPAVEEKRASLAGKKVCYLIPETGNSNFKSFISKYSFYLMFLFLNI